MREDTAMTASIAPVQIADIDPGDYLDPSQPLICCGVEMDLSPADLGSRTWTCGDECDCEVRVDAETNVVTDHYECRRCR